MTSLPILRPTADEVLLFHPETGEQIDLLAATVDDLAYLRDVIRQAEEDQRVAKQALDAELHRRMDFEATLTLKQDGWEITGKAAEIAEYDIERLEKTLTGLVDDGELSEDAAKKALKPTVVLKPMAGELKKLAGRPGRIGEEITACRRMVPQARRATVRRAA